MKKLLNRFNSGKGDVDSLREDPYSDEEHLATHYRKPESLPAETRDTSQDIKLKKSFSGRDSPSSAGYDFSKKKNSSNGIKIKEKESKDKTKLNDSSDKALRKSSSSKLKKSISKSSELKDPDSMKSPALKSVYVSEYEHPRNREVESDDSEDDSVPRSRGNSMNDEELFTTTPIRVPSAPGRMTSPVPAYSTPPGARATPPRTPTSQASAFSAYSPPRSPSYNSPSPPHFASSPTAQVPNLPRSVSSPNPAQQTPHVVEFADDFDLRFGAGRMHTDTNVSDHDETALGQDFSRARAESISDDVDMMDEEGELMNQKGKQSGRFGFGNKAKKLK